MEKIKGGNVFILELDPGMEGYFVTEWDNLYRENKEREDIDDATKKAICRMYARMLKQIWEQELEYHKKIKEVGNYQGIQTPEFVDKMIAVLEKQLKKIENDL